MVPLPSTSSRGAYEPIAASSAATMHEPAPAAATMDEKPVSWRDLPQKQQLFVIVLARMSEPLVQTSLQSYMFYQLKWFDPSLPDATIASQAGILHASFTAAQFVTALLWGRMADSSRVGRKSVILVGLFGTSVSCLGFGFARSFWQALLFRTIGGSLNGNVGVMRTMISEIVREKKYQARAFLLLPMTFNIGVIVGPILGGILSDPAGSNPASSSSASSSLFPGMRFSQQFPYAAPNIVSCLFLLLAAAAVFLCLEETLEGLRQQQDDNSSITCAAIRSRARPHGDLGIRLGRRLWAFAEKVPQPSLLRWPGRQGAGSTSRYSLLNSEPDATAAAAPSSTTITYTTFGEEARTGSSSSNSNNDNSSRRRRYTQRLAFRRIFTKNVLMTLFAQFLLTLHIGTFNSLWFVFLSTPTETADEHETRRLPFRFTGGLGMRPQSVGAAMAMLGVIGIALQLLLYPRLSARLGTLLSWRVALVLFPFVYFAVPYLAVVPSKTGPAIWVAICAVLSVHVTARTFVLPSQVILVNNCSPHPSVLGTVHGLGQSISSLGRTLGPVVGGVIYGYGLSEGYVGLVFWLLSCVAVCACLASLLVTEGDGHEIWLEGDEGPVDAAR